MNCVNSNFTKHENIILLPHFCHMTALLHISTDFRFLKLAGESLHTVVEVSFLPFGSGQLEALTAHMQYIISALS